MFKVPLFLTVLSFLSATNVRLTGLNITGCKKGSAVRIGYGESAPRSRGRLKGKLPLLIRFDLLMAFVEN